MSVKPETDGFQNEVLRSRAEYEERRLRTNLYPPGGRPNIDLDVHHGEKPYMTYWFEDGDSARGQCVRIFDVPGTLSGDILRLRQQLPDKPGHFEVDGNDIRELDHCLPHPDFVGDDSENVSEVMASLPLVQVDAAKHFLKKPKYNSEIQNLKKCQNGAVPGHSASRNIIQLFGRSSNGELVFEKLRPSQATLALYSSLPIYKTWILQLLDGLECLHSFGIIHKDLRADNLLFSADASRLILRDLESVGGSVKRPKSLLMVDLKTLAGQRNLTSTTWETVSGTRCMGTTQSHLSSNGLCQRHCKALWMHARERSLRTTRRYLNCGSW